MSINQVDHTGFKVWVKTFGDDKFYTNAKVFDTKEEAENWGQGLLGRWMLAEAFEVREVTP